MRRVIALGIAAILVSSCGQSELPTGLGTTLQEQVALIRETAEAGRPGYARSHLNELVAMVTSRLQQGLIEEGRALEILESAEAVGNQLSLLPQPTPTQSRSPSPSPSPSQEEGSSGDGNGRGKGKGKGKGEEGHGNED
ncbi:MAG: hypothetical protein M3138_00140 [Actinomycetota bacterium]|nr:hypothetical protein [Actinomycetota bacterium]